MTGDTEINFTLRIDGIGAVAAPLVTPGTSPVKARADRCLRARVVVVDFAAVAA